jgi:hypothetical protein
MQFVGAYCCILRHFGLEHVREVLAAQGCQLALCAQESQALHQNTQFQVFVQIFRTPKDSFPVSAVQGRRHLRSYVGIDESSEESILFVVGSLISSAAILGLEVRRQNVGKVLEELSTLQFL